MHAAIAGVSAQGGEPSGVLKLSVALVRGTVAEASFFGNAQRIGSIGQGNAKREQAGTFRDARKNRE